MQNKEFVELTYPIVKGNQLYDYKILRKDMESLKMLYPFINEEVIGESVCGRDIVHFKIGKGNRKIHINASFHGNEWLTTAILMKFVNEYCLSLSNNQQIEGMKSIELYQEFTFSFVPMVNPDGVQIVLHGPENKYKDKIEKINTEDVDYTWWKANINGIDLNNQFPANWHIEKERKYVKSPAPRDFPGEYPLSEPESIAMKNLVIKEKFDIVVALHSQGKEIYWGYGGHEPVISKKLVSEMERVSGYQAIKYIDSHAGFRDWFIMEFEKPGFTIEVGKGVNPLPLSSFQQNYQDVKRILLSMCK